MNDLRKELDSIRTFLENNARTGADIVAMQGDLEMVLGYAERVASICAELTEKITINANTLLDQYIGDEGLTDFEKKTKIGAAQAGDVRLLAEFTALGRRLRDTRWVLLQACSIRKAELLKLH